MGLEGRGSRAPTAYGGRIRRIMDVRHAFRRLTATPLLSLGAMLTLALGIGSAVVMVDILDRLLLRAPAGITEPDRVARVYFGNGNAQAFSELSSYAKFESLAFAIPWTRVLRTSSNS